MSICAINIYFIRKKILSASTPQTMNSTELNEKIETTHKEMKNLELIAGRKEILFDGYFYDVTDFIKKHPGGRIISYYTNSGEDSTHAIQQFHYRSIKRVKVMMNSLKKRPASISESNLINSQSCLL